MDAQYTLLLNITQLNLFDAKLLLNCILHTNCFAMHKINVHFT